MNNLLNLIAIPLVSCFSVNFTDKYLALNDHAVVRKSHIYPYTVAILKKNQYISAGALIHKDWVLTAADSLYLLQEVIRLIQVRLGTTNYKQGGVTLPCKYFEIHPKFDDKNPLYDIALMRLPRSIEITPSIKPIKLEKKQKLKVSHFTVTAWPAFKPRLSSSRNRIRPMEVIDRHRILTVSHLHQTEQMDCIDVIGNYSMRSNDEIMCLDPADENDAKCRREVGAPVVHNGMLRGIISSWRPDTCTPWKNLVVVNMVTSKSIRTWIHSIVHDKKWTDDYGPEYETNCPVSDYEDADTVDYEASYTNLVN